MKSPDADSMVAGDTVLEDSAKKFACHSLGNAVSVRPLHVVFFQHCWASTEVSRRRKVTRRIGTFMTAILGSRLCGHER
jgi:hypothetical protein